MGGQYKKTPKPSYMPEYTENSFYVLDEECNGVFCDDSKKEITRKQKKIKRILKDTWIKGYKKALIDIK